MDNKDWEELVSTDQHIPQPWELDANIYPLSSATMTIAIMVSARDGDEELVKRLFDLANEDLLIEVPITYERGGRIRSHEFSPFRFWNNASSACPSLSHVIFAGHLNIAKLLLGHGFTVDDKAFNIVFQTRDYNLFGHFLSVYTGYMRKIEVEDDSIPILCAEEGKLLLENKLISAHNGIFIDIIPIAIWVISNGNPNLLIKILEGFSTYDIYSWNLLLNAAVKLHKPEMLEEILRSLKKIRNTPERGCGVAVLVRAVQHADIESVSLLLAFGVCPSTWVGCWPPRVRYSADSVLSIAIKEHSPDREEILPVILRLLSNTGDIIEEKNGMHNTALLAAVAADNLYSVQLLINSGFSVNEMPTRETLRTPLQAACFSSSHAMINFLLDNGANVNAPAFKLRGATALQFAVIRGDEGTVKHLLERNADLNAPGARAGARTAVEAAAEHGRACTLESYLLNAQTWDGEFGKRQYKRACKLAEKNRRETVRWILERSWTETRVKLLQPANNDGNESGVDETLQSLNRGIERTY